MGMEKEILNLKEYDLLPLIDEFWEEKEEYQEVDENECLICDEGDNLILKKGEWNNFKLIEAKLNYYDLEDSYEINDNIIQRLSDGKYFKFFSKYTYCDELIIPNQEIKEVFPIEKTITVYE